MRCSMSISGRSFGDSGAVNMQRGTDQGSSLSKSLPYPRKERSNSPPRPSTARSSRSAGSLSPISKTSSTRKSSSPQKANSRSVQFDDLPLPSRTVIESPDEWFCRVMRTKQLSPQDLADIFAYGDASKNRKVALSHVCEVMFDLDPEQATQIGPVSERMEEFLYEHSFDDGGEIVVDIKQALRALDIWGLGHPGRSKGGMSPPKSSGNPRTKEVWLEARSKKLSGVVANLQSENERLSLKVEAARTSTSNEDSSYSTDCKGTHTSKSPVARSTSRANLSKQPSSSADDELAIIANELTYTGVKELEQRLAQLDKSSSGFVSLKQLRWLLVDHFSIEISETRLLEICLGMNFNPQAQIDYRDFITALLDLLIYSVRDMAPSGKNNALTQLENYIASGFSPDRSKTRKLLEQLCRKYDLESDGCITLVEFLRVLHHDLVEEHALRLAFPLSEKETIQLILTSSVRPIEESQAASDSTAAFVYYDDILDVLFGGEPGEDEAGVNRIEQAYSWAFWERVRKTLCNGSRSKEANVLEQILKIVRKLDRDQSYTMSPLFFKRIFDQHLRSEDLYAICRSLRLDDVKGSQRQTLRYDVFLYLTFGEPRVKHNNRDPIWTSVCAKLKANERSLRVNVTDVMRVNGADWQLGIQAFCDLVNRSAESELLLPVEQLYIFSILASPSKRVAQVEVRTLWSFLIRDCWNDNGEFWGTKQHLLPDLMVDSEEDSDISTLRNDMVTCLADYNLERALASSIVKRRAWIGRAKLAAELVQMLRSTGRYKSEKYLIRMLNEYLKSVAEQTSSERDELESPPFPDAISLDAFFESLFDWSSLARAMKLPENLVDVNKHMQLFDWEKSGSIRCEDWNKAWRQICVGFPGMYDWQIRVLQRRFPGATSGKREHSSTTASSMWSETINYSRLLVFLLDFQQQGARQELLRLVRSTIQRESTTSTGELSTFRLEKLFRSIDRDGKNYINGRDFTSFLSQHIDSMEDDADVKKLLENADAIAYVMRTLSGESAIVQQRGSPRSCCAATSKKLPVMSFSCFRHILSEIASPPSKNYTLGQTRHQYSNASPTASSHQAIVSSLRSLELTILEISRQISGLDGQILPLCAFRYFLTGSSSSRSSESYSPAKSPMKRGRKDELSSPIKVRQREVEASTDPLTAEKLKQTLYRHHHVTASTHLISQFFQHIGSTSKQFLDLVTFTKWVAPLSVDLEAKVRTIVKKMIVKGKGGGGKVDLDRFVAQLERRLMDSPWYSSLGPEGSFASYDGCVRVLPRLVPTSLLLAKLHLLNIPIGRNDMTMLLRHFGMDDRDEYVDYVLFLQRLYECNASGRG